MDIELNPKIDEHSDLKLFIRERPGMVAWTLMFVPSIKRHVTSTYSPETMLTYPRSDISNIVYQYQSHHRVGLSLVLVTILHSLYVLDFFVNEAWYLWTIEIAQDQFGSYLAWGYLTWVRTMCTPQVQYLGLYPTSPSTAYLAVEFGIDLAVFALFRSVINEKD